jgi:hypothetical protein
MERRGTLIDTKNGKIYTTIPSQPPQPLTKLQSYQIQVDLARCRGQWKLLHDRLLGKLKKYQQVEKVASTGIVGPGNLADVVHVECLINQVPMTNNFDLDLNQILTSNHVNLHKSKTDLLKIIGSVPSNQPSIPQPLILLQPSTAPTTLVVHQQALILLARVELVLGNTAQVINLLASNLNFFPPPRNQVVELSYYSAEVPPSIIGWTAYQRILVIQGWTLLATAYFHLGHYAWAKGIWDLVISFYNQEMALVYGGILPISNGKLVSGTTPNTLMQRERQPSIISINSIPLGTLSAPTVLDRRGTLDLAATNPLPPILAPSAVANTYQQSITTGILSYSTGTSGMSTKAVQAYTADAGDGDQLVKWAEEAYWRRCVSELLPGSITPPNDDEVPVDQRFISDYFERFPPVFEKENKSVGTRLIPLIESRLWFLVSRGVRMDKIETIDWDGAVSDDQEDLEEEDDLLSVQGITPRLCPRFPAANAWYTQALALMTVYEEMTTDLSVFPQANQGVNYTEENIVDRFGASPVLVGNVSTPVFGNEKVVKQSKLQKNLKRIKVIPKDSTKNMFRTLSHHILGDLLDKNRRITGLSGVVDPTSAGARRLKRVQDLYEIWAGLVLGSCHHGLACRHGVGLSTVGSLAQGNVWYNDTISSVSGGSNKILGVIPPGSVVLEDERVTYVRLQQLLATLARATTHTFLHLPMIRCIIHAYTSLIHCIPDSMTNLDVEEAQRWMDLYLELWNTGWKRRKEVERKRKEDELLLKMRANPDSPMLTPPNVRERSRSESSVNSIQSIQVLDSDVPCWVLSNGETLDDYLGVLLAHASWYLLPHSNFCMGDATKVDSSFQNLDKAVKLLGENKQACPRGLRFVARCQAQGRQVLGSLALEQAMQTSSVEKKTASLESASTNLQKAIWGMQSGLESEAREAPSTLDLNSIELRDGAWEPLYHLALTNWQLGSAGVAMALVQKCLTLNPNVPAAWHLLLLLLSASDDLIGKAETVLDASWKELVVIPASSQLTNPPPNVEYQWSSIGVRDRCQLINLRTTGVWVIRGVQGPLGALQSLQSLLALFSRMFPGMLDKSESVATGTLKRMQSTLKDLQKSYIPSYLQPVQGRKDSIASVGSYSSSGTRPASPTRASITRSVSPSRVVPNSIPFPAAPSPTVVTGGDQVVQQAMSMKPIYHFAPHHHLLTLWLTASHLYRDLDLLVDAFACVAEARSILEKIASMEVLRELGGSGTEAVDAHADILNPALGARAKIWGRRSKRVIRCLVDVEVEEAIIVLLQRSKVVSENKMVPDALARYRTTDVAPMDKLLTESQAGVSKKRETAPNITDDRLFQALEARDVDRFHLGTLDHHFKQPTLLPQLSPDDALLDVLIEHLHSCSLLLDTHGPLRVLLGHLYSCKGDWAMAEYWLDRSTARQAVSSGSGDASALGGNWWVAEAWALMSRVMWKTGRISDSLECLEWSKRVIRSGSVRGVEVVERIA